MIRSRAFRQPAVSQGERSLLLSGRPTRPSAFVWNSVMPIVSAMTIVIAVACGSPAAPISRTLVGPGPGVPVFDSTNPNHVLHVFEDWSAYSSASQVGVINRADGGGLPDLGVAVRVARPVVQLDLPR